MSMQFTKTYRIWHWTLALSTVGLLITVFLRKTFLSWRDNAAIITEKLAENDIEVSAEIAKATAKAIRAPMWEWHYIFGAFLALAVAIRIYMFLSKQAKIPLVVFIEAPKEEKPQRLVYMLLCASLVFMTLSGWFYYFKADLGFVKEQVHWVKELHEFLMWPIVVLVAMHIAGVLRHELVTKEGIVSKMIHGDTIK